MKKKSQNLQETERIIEKVMSTTQNELRHNEQFQIEIIYKPMT